MKYLFIFLTLPFFVCADQQNLDKYQIEYLEIQKMKEFYSEEFYEYKLIMEDGHLFQILFIHSNKCPCLRY